MASRRTPPDPLEPYPAPRPAGGVPPRDLGDAGRGSPRARLGRRSGRLADPPRAPRSRGMLDVAVYAGPHVPRPVPRMARPGVQLPVVRIAAGAATRGMDDESRGAALPLGGDLGPPLGRRAPDRTRAGSRPSPGRRLAGRERAPQV